MATSSLIRFSTTLTDVTQLEIEDDEIDQVLGYEPAHPRPIMSGRYLVALVGKIVPDEFAYFGFVIDDEDMSVMVHVLNVVCPLARVGPG